jgi:hypothetical protein
VAQHGEVPVDSGIFARPYDGVGVAPAAELIGQSLGKPGDLNLRKKWQQHPKMRDVVGPNAGASQEVGGEFAELYFRVGLYGLESAGSGLFLEFGFNDFSLPAI